MASVKIQYLYYSKPDVRDKNRDSHMYNNNNNNNNNNNI
jgi:hypothetical protein